jgi:hypothetical protein
MDRVRRTLPVRPPTDPSRGIARPLPTPVVPGGFSPVPIPEPAVHTLPLRMPSHSPARAPRKGAWGDVGALRGAESTALGGFTAGRTMKASAAFRKRTRQGR